MPHFVPEQTEMHTDEIPCPGHTEVRGKAQTQPPHRYSKSAELLSRWLHHALSTHGSFGSSLHAPGGLPSPKVQASIGEMES